MAVEPGQSLAHYRIERLIGQGGMGSVFLAVDTRLDRKVALKIPAGIAAAESWADAEGHFDEALRLAEGLPHRVDQAEIRRWHARRLLDRDAAGDRQRARTLLEEACSLYERIGMPFHKGLADGMLAESS